MVKLAIALALALTAVDARKLPSMDHQNEMKRRLQESAKHVINGGPRESKLERVNELLETHGGFVTDMITTYRPSLISKWLKKAYDVRALSKAASSERRLSKNDEDPGSDTGACYDTYREEFNCMLESCWCDRALDQSGDRDISTTCDDSSEYASYACDISMLPLDCKIAADDDCIPDECEGTQCDGLQDDWAIRFFTNGTSRVVVSDDVIEDANDECRGWPLNCCGSSDCTEYNDATCETAGTQCAPFMENVWPHEDPPSPAPTWSHCDGYTPSRRWTWQSEFDGYKDDGVEYDDAACSFTAGASASYSDVAAAAGYECSQAYCTSPSDDGGYDCWAGSEGEPCTCSEGEARETGSTLEWEGQTYYDYTCCLSGNNVGEQCGDYTGGELVAVIIFLLFVLCLIGCVVGVCLCICKARGDDVRIEQPPRA